MDNENELVNMLRAVIHEELKPVNERLAVIEGGLQELRQDVHELKTGQDVIEAIVNDLRATNRRTHKEIFSQLHNMWDDIKRLSSSEERAVR